MIRQENTPSHWILSFPCFHHVVNYLPSFHWYYKFSVENMSDYNEGLIKENNTASVV